MSSKRASDHTDQHVVDEGEITQSAVLKRIQRARDDIAEVKRQRVQGALEGQDNGWNYRRAYYFAVDALCGELRSYLQNDEIPLSKKFWEQEAIGEIEFEPPSFLVHPDRQAMSRAIGSGGKDLAMSLPRNTLETKTYTVQGLKDFNSADEVLWESWQVRFGPEVTAADLRERNSEQGVFFESRASRHEPIVVHRMMPLPVNVIQKAEAMCVKFALELGMDLDFEYEPHVSEEPGL